MIRSKYRFWAFLGPVVLLIVTGLFIATFRTFSKVSPAPTGSYIFTFIFFLPGFGFFWVNLELKLSALA
jgi:hypothetical protein